MRTGWQKCVAEDLRTLMQRESFAVGDMYIEVREDPEEAEERQAPAFAEQRRLMQP